MTPSTPSSTAAAATDKDTKESQVFNELYQEAVPDPEQKKHLSTLALIGLSYAILNTWAASSGSIYIGLSSGGPTAVVYGTIVGTLGALAVAISLAEMCHLIPSKGAQYHWCYAFAYGCKAQRILSYYTGWMGVAGWIALTSTAPYFTANSIIVLVQLYHPDFVAAPWITFVIYMAMTIYSAFINIYGARVMNAMNTAALIYSVVGAVTIFVTVLAASGAHGTMRDAKFIFATFINTTGWPDGVAWILGLLQTQYSLVGADGAAHLVDEISNPRRNAPIAMVLSCAIGGVSALLVCIAFLAAITDPEAVIAALGGSSLVVLLQALGNHAGVVVLGTIFILTQMFTMPALMISCTRMIQSFSKDDCLPFKRQLGSVSKKYETPVWAVGLNAGFLTLFGVLIFASPLAILAVQSASVVMLMMSYLPVTTLFLIRGRRRVNELNVPRTFTLGNVYGPIINILALIYNGVLTVFFLFPSVYPVVDVSLMNYAVVVLAISFTLATINWFAWARKHFTAPIGLIDMAIDLAATDTGSIEPK